MHSEPKTGAAAAFWNTFLIQNIVLVQAVNLCPIVAVGTTLKNGVVLALCTALVLLPISFVMSVCGEKIPGWVRPLLYTVSAGVLMAGAAWLLKTYISEELYAKLYVFLPLTAVSSVFSYHAGGFSVRNTPATALLDSLGSSLGFGLVICLVGALREMAAFGTLWGVPLGLPLVVSEAAEPFFAFLLLAFMAALLQWIRSKQQQRSRRKEAREP